VRDLSPRLLRFLQCCSFLAYFVFIAAGLNHSKLLLGCGSLIFDHTAFELEAASLSGRTGPPPAFVRSMADAISTKSCCVSETEAAPIQPSTCSGVLAPTIAPVTAGHARSHAMAIEATDVSCRLAIGRSASRRARLRPRSGCPNSGARRRQSSAANEDTRSAVKASVSRPDCIGL
jgi:hypothetical protein